MAGLDWDRERRDRPRRERGSDPINGPAGPRRSHCEPAPKQKIDAETSRLLAEFAALPYGGQLAYLTDVRRSLYRLVRDEDAVAMIVKTRFKPLLKIGGGRRPPSPPLRTATASPPPPQRHLLDEALRLIRRLPSSMTQKQCVKALKEGACQRYTIAEIKSAIRDLRARGSVVIDKHGRLRPA